MPKLISSLGYFPVNTSKNHSICPQYFLKLEIALGSNTTIFLSDILGYTCSYDRILISIGLIIFSYILNKFLKVIT